MPNVAPKFIAGCLLGLLAVDATGAAITNARSNKGAILRFAWPTSTMFKLEESVRKGETEVVLLHTLSLQTNNDELLLRWRNTQVESINGMKVDSPEKKKLSDPIRAMYLATPPFRISQKGRFLGTVNLDEAISETSKQLDRLFPERNQAQREEFLRVLKNPTMKKLVEQLYSEYWTDWVDNWNEVELKASEETETEAEVRLSPGSHPVPMKFRLKNLGATATNATFLHLRSEYSSDDSKTLQGVKGLVDSLANEISDGRPLDTNGVSKLSISIKREVVTNPSTLLPSWARRERLAEFIDAGKLRRAREVHEYRFFWDVPD